MSISNFNHVYLHGFASGPGSTKAQFFKAKFAESKTSFVVPDLNQPSFREMTISSQIAVVEQVVAKLPDPPIVLWGSSMGGLVSTLFAHQNKNRVRALILLAPGFDLINRWRELMGEENLARWKNEGAYPFFNYASKQDEKLDWSFFEDCLTHQTTDLKIDCPTVIFHGLNDETVPITASREFVRANSSHVKLFELADGHELIDSLDFIWRHTCDFLNELQTAV